jgi:two-component system chemotaxis sensor kinase CheA
MASDFDDALEQFKATFFEESAEQLADVEERLAAIRASLENTDAPHDSFRHLILEQKRRSAEADLHATFRAVHSVKGGAGAFEFKEVVDFAHRMETLLDLMRNGEANINIPIVDLLIAANDILVALVEAARTGSQVNAEQVADVARRLDVARGNEPPANQAEAVMTPPAEPAGGAAAAKDDRRPSGPSPAVSGAGAPARSRRFAIDFRPNAEIFKFGNDPLLLLRELQTLGPCTITVRDTELPQLGALDPETCYLAWQVEIETDRDRDAIEEVFEFVIDDCTLEITEQTEPSTEAADAPGEAASGGSGAAPAAETTAAPTAGPNGAKTARGNGQADAPGRSVATASPGSGAGDKGVRPHETPSGQTQAGPNGTVHARQESTTRSRGGRADSGVSSIRVELERVDRLVNMVGELVITQAMLRQQLSELPDEHANSMSQGFEDLDMHLRELQESVMAVRMQPVGSVFARMPRLVRDLSSRLGKRADLIMSGESTEVDKTIIEQLADPLTHMIRNALDHGIEDAAARRESGKSETATIWLNAEHKSGRIVITVADDGRGINREKVLKKAIERGIIAPDAEPTNEEIDELIYAPGFSTSEKVTDLSGRGVGMDVVRQNILSLGGRLSVQSEPGEGTRFVMSLPLTLAVLDGMVVAVGSEYYILPLTTIIESIRPQPGQVHKLANGAEVLAARGGYIRLARLYDLFGIEGAIESPEYALVVIADVEGGDQIGILVDEMLGQQQVVIKSLEENYGYVPGIAAATILGSGRVALILDVKGLDDVARARRGGHGRLAGDGGRLALGGRSG